MREFCEKHYVQILSFMAEKAHNEKLKDVRSRLSHHEDTEQETENTSHHRKRKRRANSLLILKVAESGEPGLTPVRTGTTLKIVRYSSSIMTGIPRVGTGWILGQHNVSTGMMVFQVGVTSNHAHERVSMGILLNRVSGSVKRTLRMFAASASIIQRGIEAGVSLSRVCYRDFVKEMDVCKPLTVQANKVAYISTPPEVIGKLDEGGRNDRTTRNLHPSAVMILGIEERTEGIVHRETLQKHSPHFVSGEDREPEADFRSKGRKRQSRKTQKEEDEDLPEPYDEESTTFFTRRINKFVFPKRIWMPSTVKIHDGTGDPEDYLKSFTTATMRPTSLKERGSHESIKTSKNQAKTKILSGMRILDGVQEIEEATASHRLQRPPKEILAMEAKKGTFTALPSMSGVPESRNKHKYYDFHGDKGHSTDDCLHLKRQIKEAQASKEGGSSSKGQRSCHLHGPIMGRNVHPRSIVYTSPQMYISFPPLRNMDIEDHPIFICAEISGHDIHRMYVGRGSVSEILYEHCFYEVGDKAQPNICGYAVCRILKRNDLAFGTNSPTGIFGKVLVPSYSVDELFGSKVNFAIQRDPRTERAKSLEILIVRQATVPLPQPEKSVKGTINPEYPEQSLMIGGNLSNEGKKAICEVLKANLDVFAWKLADMTGVPKILVGHKLGIKESTSSVKQKKRGQATERSKFITEEVQKLVETGIIREVAYHSWISNPVLVKKHDGDWATEGMFMGHAISREGIQAWSEKNPSHDQHAVPLDIKRGTKLKWIISKPQQSDFVWTEEAKKALKEMKKQMAELPTLTAPIEGETFVMYVFIVEEAVSAVLLAK
nr:hypothetical protein [Tanacetum cinerariifolium]